MASSAEPSGYAGWWHVDVVLRCADAGGDGGESFLREVERLVEGLERPDDPRAFAGVHPAYSYDMSPPEGSVGASFWLKAVTAGSAVDLAIDLCGEAASAVLGQVLPVWDIRILPLQAVTSRNEYPELGGRPLVRPPSRREAGDGGGGRPFRVRLRRRPAGGPRESR